MATYQELKNQVEQIERSAPSPVLQEQRVKDSLEIQIRLDGLRDYYQMRRTWSKFLKNCLLTILLFNVVLVFGVGTGQLSFTDEWFLRLVLTTNLADIIGLVVLVVKFLFSD